ncbi:MAG: mycofactocin biosynthesis glycosyltransferase MftF [Deferrisomatales bacterium]|nr:mycofactocin biosynthesis glycosyltransferase MftF [Deferrisomatales bacterium]
MSFSLAPGVTLRATEEGKFLLAERPLRAVRVNEALYRLLSREGALSSGSRGEAHVLEALARAGYLERQAGEDPGTGARPSVTVVIPVKDRADELERCLASLERLRYPRELLEVIVVDDGSTDESPAVARAHGARVVASGGCGAGPASARNRGAREARGELLAFIDSDCTSAPDWLAELVGRFADPEVGAVGGRVEGMHCATRLDQYEARMSSLSLGDRELSGRDGDDTFYVPSCNILVRRSAFREAGGFRAGMHVGEDVDLSWRLRDRGYRLVYVPRGWVYHEHRNRLAAFLRRRFEYGTSEALLQGRHPRRRKKLAAPSGLVAVLGCGLAALLGAGWTALFAAALVLLLDASRAQARFRRVGLGLGLPRALASRARAAASLAYYVGYHAIRYYGWPLLLASALFPRLGAVVLLLLLGVAAVDHRVRRVSLGYPAFLFYYTGEQLAYGAGVFWGCLRHGTFRSYLAQVSVRPARGLRQEQAARG